MKTKSIGFIGGGRITKIILQGFKNKYIEFSSIKVCDKDNSTLTHLKKMFPNIEIADSPSEVVNQEVVFIALHPHAISETITQLKNAFGDNTLIISLAPKFRIDKLSELSGTELIARMIPNATSYINKGYNPVCFSNNINSNRKTSILDMLAVLGNTFETEEYKLEAFAIASAMLPTYFWFQWQEMEKIAKRIGLSEKESQNTIYESLKASLEIMYNSNLNYKEVTDLIPVKPISEKETDIKEILNNNLISLYDKIKT